MGAGQGPFVINHGIESDVVWRLNDHGELAAARPIMVASGNGTTPFGKIAGGTIMGKMSSGTKSGMYRPCFKGLVNGNQAAVNEVLLVAGQAANAYVGDVVKVVRPSTGAVVASTRTLSVVNKTTHKVTLSGAAITFEDGDLVMLENGAGTAKAATDRAIVTTYQNKVTGLIAEQDQGPCKLWPVAMVKASSLLTGWNAYVAADLPGFIVD
jgi:hypothetical protein